MKRRGWVLVVLSLGLGALSAWGANNWVKAQLSGDDGVNGEQVVVAAMDIPYGTKVEGRHVGVISMPIGSAPQNAFREQAAIEGKVATMDIARGEILLGERFADHDGGSTLAALVGQNMRAVTVRVDDVVGVAGFLLPGNRVDVVASRLDQRTRLATTETILTNLKVLAVDQTASTDKNEPVIVRAVTLEMKPEQSEAIVKAKEEGTIQLTLRNPNDKSMPVVKVPEAPTPTPVVVTRAPVSSGPPHTVVTIIRGTHVDSTKAKL
jgi:pilus assembly protein CpaB